MKNFAKALPLATNGTWVNGGPEVFAAPEVLDRDILILGRDPAHDLYIGTLEREVQNLSNQCIGKMRSTSLEFI